MLEPLPVREQARYLALDVPGNLETSHRKVTMWQPTLRSRSALVPLKKHYICNALVSAELTFVGPIALI
jgi:hypothetical protein